MFVIVGTNNIAVPIEYLGMIISSKIEKARYKENKILPKDDNNNLDMDSIVKTDVLYKIENMEMVLKIGKVDEERVKEYSDAYLKIIRSKNANN